MSNITTSQLAIYAALILPVLYILVKHGRHGLLGWFYLHAFCLLRVIGGALTLSKSSSALIVGNIGLSPLLLAACGILHESMTYSGSALKSKVRWIIVIMYHMIVLAATALVASGGQALQGSSPTTESLTKLKAGIAILIVAWVVLVVLAILPQKPVQNETSQNAKRIGKQLRLTVLFALVFIGIRIIYTLVAFVSQAPSLSPVSGSLAIRVTLSLFPELIASFAFVFVGIMTQHCRRELALAQSALPL